jgi:hypothetical protein
VFKKKVFLFFISLFSLGQVNANIIVDLDGNYSVTFPKVSSSSVRYTFYEKNKSTNVVQTKVQSSNIWNRNNLITGQFSYRYKSCYEKYNPRYGEAVWTCSSTKALSSEYLVVLATSSITTPIKDIDGSFNITWSKVSGATGYLLQQSKNQGA